MQNIHEDSTIVSSDDMLESVVGIDPLNSRLPTEPPLEPYEGMEFASIEETRIYYTRYAKNTGFSFRMGRVTKSRTNGMIIGREFLCSKEGFRAKKYVKEESNSIIVHNETMVGCKEMLYLKKNGEIWIVSRFVRDHNHELFSPKSSQFLRVHRKKTNVQKKIIDVFHDSGLGPSKIRSVLCTESGGVDNVRFSPQDVINYLTEKRQKKLENGDAQMMLSYFKSCQLKNPGFFYAFQMEAEGILANCFWVDSRSKMAYKYFGDVVTFDPTYLTNKYKMPFVPFTGVNHHQQSILFGCALLWDETIESFFWLLSTWLEAMSGISPKTIITDQDAAISNAVAKCIHQSTTVEEFDSDCEAIIDKYGLQDNQWLNKIFSIREKWIPAYVRHNFCAGMSTTQRSESMNKYFKDFLNSSTSLSQFVTRYEKALDARYNKEREKTFKTRNSKPLLRTLYPMEEETSKIYTRKMFRIFQDELVGSQLFITEKVKFSIEVSTYKVREIYKEKPIYYVNFHVTSKEANCSCHMFECSGILCRHVLCVFIKKNVYCLPSQYVLHRWSINAKKEKYYGSLPRTIRKRFTIRKTSRYCNSKQNGIAKLDLLDIEESNKKFVDSASEDMPKVFDVNIALHDPPLIATKGRPRTLRMKSSLEMVRKGSSSTCSYCMKKGHTKPKCPNLNQTR
ncbi:protein FAR1-RELATED SEQUENCE 5 [Lathyrus oleraceus]|uniref:protein FAR1-RELATED SEQUENCE 5 n=1 Tax=Pisum sativum TaxID=3888 RepID=UPI0021CE003E|nr:protein FAR1-RELATED SEQUENCE 5-like [Pisum sativum]